MEKIAKKHDAKRCELRYRNVYILTFTFLCGIKSFDFVPKHTYTKTKIRVQILTNRTLILELGWERNCNKIPQPDTLKIVFPKWHVIQPK